MKRALLLLALVVASCSDQPMPEVGDLITVSGVSNQLFNDHHGKVVEVRGTWVRLGDPKRPGDKKDAGHWVDVSRFPVITIVDLKTVDQ